MTFSALSRINGYEFERIAPSTFVARGEAGVFQFDTKGLRGKDIPKFLAAGIYRIHGQMVRERAGHRCEACGAICPLEVDHIVARGMGGANRDDRLVNLRALGTSAAGGGCGCHARRHKEGL